MGDKLEEVRKDLAELELLATHATRQNIKDLLSIQIRKLSSLIMNSEAEVNNSKPSDSKKIDNVNKCYQVKLNNYAWDQSPKFLKLYVTLAKAQTLPAENVYCSWTNKSVELNAKGLENKDYIFTVKNLLNDIDPSRSSWKVKSDMIVILLAKVKEITWSHVTEFEKKASSSRKMLPTKNYDNKDPGDSLMSMMKKMYESGDDEMKRTIAKAWTEGQNKKLEL